jgi:hypothetical protein
MKKIIIWLFVMSVVLASVRCLAQEKKKEIFQASGIVLTYDKDVLRIQQRLDVGIIRLHTFKITSETKISGNVRVDGWVSVFYTQVRFGRRLIMTAVEIQGFGR